ncbi:DUF3953 domain-containing protein [Salimicrobium halophilum]|uniref:DUF3953 domain-containing protein n=1 Tax=Salimicrobium halophilum TaxID=86666 RepID=A0A1G8RCL8_9BACI|nr:DUF3953 domain-containing protein [Salimicrobium halophilum]SDJ14671.1 Protein of unknown function [Salimicrobium halophilum]
MKILRLLLGAVVSALACFSLITGTTGITPYLLLLVSGLVLVMGITEFQKRKPIAFTLFLAFGFSFFVGIYTL